MGYWTLQSVELVDLLFAGNSNIRNMNMRNIEYEYSER